MAIKKPTYTVASMLLLALAGCSEMDADESFRMLPVSAVTADGAEVLVGVFDEQDQSLDLIWTFVDSVEAQAASELSLIAEGETASFDLVTSWQTLGEGDNIEIVGAELTGGILVIHEPGWTDGLTEAEAASSFPACYDPPEDPWNPDPWEPIELE